MNRKTFLKLLSTTPLIPLMPVKKKENVEVVWYDWDTPIKDIKIIRSKFSKDGSVNIDFEL